MTDFADYGYTCRYNREVKKRGRVPSSSTRHHPQSPSEISPTSPLTSPEANMQPLGSHQTLQGRSEQSFASTRDDGHMSIANSSGNSPSASKQQSVHHATPSHGSGSGQILLSSLLESAPNSPGRKASLVSPRQTVGAASSAAAQGNFGVKGIAEQASPEKEAFMYPQRSRSSHGQETVASQGQFRREETTPQSMYTQSPIYTAPTADCRYRCLEPVLPYLSNIISASTACDLLDVYLTEPGSSLFRCASPYIVTRVFRKKSMLHPTNPRPTTPALLATMLWCSAQTADIVLLHVPGSRAKICTALYDLATALIADRDPDRWRRTHGISPHLCLTGWRCESLANLLHRGLES